MGIEKHAEKLQPPPMEYDGKICLIGFNKQELTDIMAERGYPAFRAKQLWHWIYYHGARDFENMTTISKDLRRLWSEEFCLTRPEPLHGRQSLDGTYKWLSKLVDLQDIESVYIPEEDRGTLCVSSQVGCTLSCRFCHTGTQKLVRNLSAGEIVGQLMTARDYLGEWPTPFHNRKITNIVLMGMGEPLYNYENVAKAMQIIMDEQGISISSRKITLSTSGVVPLIERCGQELGVNLAISLHAVRDDLRDILVPLNKKYPIRELLRACRQYPGLRNARRITFEYVMLKGVNDSVADARELIRLIQGIPAKVNLIPFNPWPGTEYECSTEDTIHRFADIVMDAGYASPIRTPRGRDILAACGQLKTESTRPRKSAA